MVHINTCFFYGMTNVCNTWQVTLVYCVFYDMTVVYCVFNDMCKYLAGYFS